MLAYGGYGQQGRGILWRPPSRTACLSGRDMGWTFDIGDRGARLLLSIICLLSATDRNLSRTAAVNIQSIKRAYNADEVVADWWDAGPSRRTPNRHHTATWHAGRADKLADDDCAASAATYYFRSLTKDRSRRRPNREVERNGAKPLSRRMTWSIVSTAEEMCVGRRQNGRQLTTTRRRNDVMTNDLVKIHYRQRPTRGFRH